MTAGAGRTHSAVHPLAAALSCRQTQCIRSRWFASQKDIRIVRISDRLALTNRSGHVRTRKIMTLEQITSDLS